MVNTMDLGRGFLKLQEDNNSRRSSSLFRHKPLELNESGIDYVTRINCGCGKCIPFRVKVERDDGGLRIGKLTLATNCHLIIVIFGFFFLIAGSVLTALAYKEPLPDPDLPPHARASTEQIENPSRQQGKVAGPIFIIVGSCLIFVGFTLTALACKLNREAKRQLHLSRFTWETPPPQTPDIFNNSTGGISSHHQSVNGSVVGNEQFAVYSTNDTFSVKSRDISTPGSGGSSAQPGRRDSSFTYHRQQQHPPPPLSTITQAVPVGMFLFGGGGDSHVSTTSPRSPSIQVTDPSGFQEIELGSPTTDSAPDSASAFRNSAYPPQQQAFNYNNISGKKQRSQSDGASLEDFTNSHANGGKHLSPGEDSTGQKVNLALRPSLPIIPMFATSPHYFSRVVTPLDARSLYVTSRSDEPFGSIASLSTSGDIACFPVTSSNSSSSNAANTNNNIQSTAPPPPVPECDEDVSTASSCSAATTVVTTSANNNPNTNNGLSAHNRKNNGNLTAPAGQTNSATANKPNDITNTNQTVTSSPSRISELPPINVNEGFGSSGGGGTRGQPQQQGRGHVTGAPVGFRAKSIFKQSQSEDWPGNEQEPQ